MVASLVTNPTGNNKKDVVVCSAYFPGDVDHDQPPPPAIMREPVAYCKRSSKQLVIDSDVNHRDYGSIIGEGLIVNNVDSELTFVTKNLVEVLNITISTHFVSTSIVNWDSHALIANTLDLMQGRIRYLLSNSVTQKSQTGVDTQSSSRMDRETIENSSKIKATNDQIKNALINAYNYLLKEKRDLRKFKIIAKQSP